MYICMSGTGFSHLVRFLPFLSVRTWGKPIPTLEAHHLWGLPTSGSDWGSLSGRDESQTPGSRGRVELSGADRAASSLPWPKAWGGFYPPHKKYPPTARYATKVSHLHHFFWKKKLYEWRFLIALLCSYFWLLVGKTIVPASQAGEEIDV